MSDKNFALYFRNVMAGVWCGLQLRQTSVEAVGEVAEGIPRFTLP